MANARDRLNAFVEHPTDEHADAFQQIVDELVAEVRDQTLRAAADKLLLRRESLAGAYKDSGIKGRGPAAVLQAWENAASELIAEANRSLPTEQQRAS